MDLSPPWSTAVELRWRPCLDFYEQGVALLRYLDDESLLRRFRVGDHEVEADLMDKTSLTVGVTRLMYMNAHGELDNELVEKLIAHTVRHLHPSGVKLWVWLQHLQEISTESTPEAAFQAASRRWLTPGEDMALTDVAVLADGVSSQHLVYQTEFGVISAKQARGRIGRHYGNRIGGPIADIRDDDLRTPPAIGLFMDSSWQPQDAPPGAEELTGWVMLKVRQAGQDAQAALSTLYKVCVNDASASVGVGGEDG